MTNYIYGSNIIFDSRSGDDVLITAGVGQNIVINGTTNFTLKSYLRASPSYYNISIDFANTGIFYPATLENMQADSAVDFTINGAGVVTYTGATTKKFIIESHFSAYSNGNGTIDLSFGHSKNSDAITQNNTSYATCLNLQFKQCSILSYFQLSTNDTITFQVCNNTNASSINFTYFQTYITEI